MYFQHAQILAHIHHRPHTPISYSLTIPHLILLFWRASSILPALRRTTWLGLHGMTPSSCLHLFCLLDYISSIHKRLREVAYRADNILVAVDTEGDDGDEAESKPWIAFDDSCGIVALGYISWVLYR